MKESEENIELYYADPRIIRFDVNTSFLDKKIQPLGSLNMVVEPKCWQKEKPEDKILIMLRFRASIVNYNVNTEVFGCVYEFIAGVVPQYNEIDIEGIKEYVGDAFLNFQTYFEQNVPKEIKHIRFDTDVDKEELSVRLLDLVYKG
ncbi:hypothetical protein E1J38_013530 [Seonamhaeicola sediminis]|uniref:Uncharacterized protein n=1 Tax=Seonamhaeicola sediminis TaxID=2528206 RepID=A0A562YB00_9FLAO|nr:hypothetical protein [Seonamhaeicola sediminis]TWO31538.1 hypothetical protein E1J38_013530 [Seonamhaeicola sediminis]